MWRASSHGSSMWPNITVEVERRPARWQASMISTQRATGSLFGEIRGPDAVVEHLGGRPGRRPEAALDQVVEHRVGALPGALAHVVDLHRRVGVQVDLRRDLLDQPQPAPVVLERVVRMDAALHADLGRAVVDRLLNPCLEVVLRHVVGVGRALSLPEAAERAADDADVGEVDVAVDDECRRSRRPARRAARRQRRASPRSPPGASRRTAPSAPPRSAPPLAAPSRSRAGQRPGR